MSEPTKPAPPSRRRPPEQARPVPRKAGHIATAGEHGEEHVPEAIEVQQQQLKIQEQFDNKIKTANQKINDAKKVRPREDSDSKKRRQKREQQSQPQPQPQPQPQGEGTKAGLLAHKAAFQKYQNTPNLGEIIAGKSAPKTGESLGSMLPKMVPHPDLEEPDMRPPSFLSLLEAMSDIYMRTRGRMSNKTK